MNPPRSPGWPNRWPLVSSIWVCRERKVFKVSHVCRWNLFGRYKFPPVSCEMSRLDSCLSKASLLGFPYGMFIQTGPYLSKSWHCPWGIKFQPINPSSMKQFAPVWPSQFHEIVIITGRCCDFLGTCACCPFLYISKKESALWSSTGLRPGKCA